MLAVRPLVKVLESGPPRLSDDDREGGQSEEPLRLFGLGDADYADSHAADREPQERQKWGGYQEDGDAGNPHSDVGSGHGRVQWPAGQRTENQQVVIEPGRPSGERGLN